METKVNLVTTSVLLQNSYLLILTGCSWGADGSCQSLGADSVLGFGWGR